MKPILHPEFLLPILYVLLQSVVILFITLGVLRRLQLIKLPLGGIEYSQAIFASCITFAALWISSASVGPVLQAFKALQNQTEKIMIPLAAKSAQFFIITLFFEIVLALLILLCIKIFGWLGKGISEVNNGNIPLSIILGTVIIGLSLILKLMADEITQYLIPHYLNFR